VHVYELSAFEEQNFEGVPALSIPQLYQNWDEFFTRLASDSTCWPFLIRKEAKHFNIRAMLPAYWLVVIEAGCSSEVLDVSTGIPCSPLYNTISPMHFWTPTAVTR